MKKVFSLLTAVWCMASLANAQVKTDVKIPEAVKTAFSKKHPAVAKPRWETEKQDYEVAFKENDKSFSELYNAKGELLETEESVSIKELSAAVALKVKGLKFKELAKITKANGTVVYEAEVKGKDLLFDTAGNAVKP